MDQDKEATTALIDINGVNISCSEDEENCYSNISQPKDNEGLVLIVTSSTAKQFKEVISALKIL